MAVTTYCCNLTFDILTVLISIADVTTDIIVLIDFYTKERMMFFFISLIILILAQCSYSIAFHMNFETWSDWHWFKTCLIFCCLLPFGTFVAFCTYFGNQDDSMFHDCFQSMGLSTGAWFTSSHSDSALTKWIKQKANRHIGFILEAGIEAFPQSLLQIIAIVYYQEANYVSIISILLSMFSVMSKSLILSQGLDKYTFIWTWICVVTDFFGIFYTVTWVFYANDSIHGEFLGYFNIFGTIWIWKVFIAVLIPVGIALIISIPVGIYFIINMIIQGGCNQTNHEYQKIIFFIFAGPIIAVLAAFVACMVAEIFCFTLFAVFVYVCSTQRISNHSQKEQMEVTEAMINFISNGGRNEKIIRILAINHGISECKTAIQSIAIQTFIAEQVHYSKIQKVSYYDIREHCGVSKRAHLIPDIINNLLSPFDTASIKESLMIGTPCIVHCKIAVAQILYGFGLFIICPIFVISKLIQICYPWIILIYLIYYDLLSTVHIFQLVMLMIYIGLQLILLFVGIKALRINWWIWHIVPGIKHVNLHGVSASKLIVESTKWYDDMIWLPIAEELVIKTFGNDIAAIVMDYIQNIEIV